MILRVLWTIAILSLPSVGWAQCTVGGVLVDITKCPGPVYYNGPVTSSQPFNGPGSGLTDIPNAALVNPSTTVNGTNCVLGQNCAPPPATTPGASGLLPTTFNCDPTIVNAYANLTTCLNAAKTFAGTGAAARVLLPAGVQSLTAPYTLSSGMQIVGVMPRDAYVANQPPDENMGFNGGTIIDCGGATNCFVGSNLRGVKLEDLGFQNYTGYAMTVGGNNVDGISFSILRNLYCIGSHTNNATTGCVQLYNFQHVRSEGLYAAYVNTVLSLIGQTEYSIDGNSEFTDTFGTVYPKSAAIGNNGTCGVEVKALTPASGSALNLNDITFTHFQVNSYNANGGTDDGTGYNVCVNGLSGKNNTAIVFHDSDIESNGNIGFNITYTINSFFESSITVTNSSDFVLGSGALTNRIDCASVCSFANLANFQQNFVTGIVSNALPGTNPLYGFFSDTNGVYHAAVNAWNSLSDGFGDLLYGQPVSVGSTSCTISPNAFSGCFNQFNGDCNTWGQFTSGSSIAVTVPVTAPIGCEFKLEQDGAGTITVGVGSGGSIHAYTGGLATRGQYDILTVKVVGNSGGSAASVRVSYGQ